MSERLRVLVADDEELARRRLSRLLGAMPDVEALGACPDAASALARLEDGDVDVLLLDVRMPGRSGLDLLRLLGADGPLVVLVTAHAEHAVDAFDGGAVDYVLKPVDPLRLRRALDRARARLGPRSTDEPLTLRTRRGLERVDADEVVAAVIDGASVVVHTLRGSFFSDLRLAELERRLPGGRFLRVHRGALVNLGRVRRLEPLPTGGYTAHLDSDLAVPVSRASARALRRAWEP